MSMAIVALDFYPVAVPVRNPFYSTGEIVIKCRPAAMGINLALEENNGRLHLRQIKVPGT